MKTVNDLAKIIASGIQRIIESGQVPSSDFTWIITTEQIFVNDYVPMIQSLQEQRAGMDYNGQMPPHFAYDEDDHLNVIQEAPESAVVTNKDFVDPGKTEGPMDPNKLDIDNTVFCIIKFGRGDITPKMMYSYPVTIRVLMMDTVVEEVRDTMCAFADSVNFVYEDGVIQSYFSPEVTDTMSEVYEGFRSVMSITGYIKVPVSDDLLFMAGISTAADTLEGAKIGVQYYAYDTTHKYFYPVDLEDGADIKNYFIRKGEELYVSARLEDIFWLSFVSQNVGQSDGQAQRVEAESGNTRALNRQKTKTVTISTYLMDGSQFSDAVIDFLSDTLNKAITLSFRSSKILRLLDSQSGEWVHYTDGQGKVWPCYKLNSNSTGNYLELITDGGFGANAEKWLITSAQMGTSLGNIDPWNVSLTIADDM